MREILCQIIIVFAINIGIAVSDEDYPDVQKCSDGYCVKFYQCNGSINTDGRSLIGPRAISISLDPDPDNPCPFGQRCCPLEDTTPPRGPTEPEVTTAPTYIPKPCGQGFPQGYLYRHEDPTRAQYGEFPWMAALLESVDDTTSTYFCAGSLIDKQVVLTAAHCLKNPSSPDDLIVRLGEWDTVNKNEPKTVQDFLVRKAIVHELFNGLVGNLHYDVALLFLEKPVQFDVHINKVCLPESAEDDPVEGNRCMVMGWGKENFVSKGQYSEVLKKIEVPFIGRRTCLNQLRKTILGPFFRLNESLLCAGGELDKDACLGDGGGALVCKNPLDGAYVQTGIVAGGIGCGKLDVPGLYANVSHVMPWIRRTLEGEGITIEYDG